MEELETKIENYLLERREWVPGFELCAQFNVTERQLRQVKGVPGLCTVIAVSGDKGFKHVALASTKEWLRHKSRIVSHAVGELRRIELQEDKRRDTTVLFRAHAYEKDTNQAVMALEG